MFLYRVARDKDIQGLYRFLGVEILLYLRVTAAAIFYSYLV